MIPIANQALFATALAGLSAHKRDIGRAFKGRFIQIFLGLKFFQNSLPSMYSGSFVATEVLQGLLDDLYAKASRAPNICVLSLFEGSYLARTGLQAPGNHSAQNTWRNNLNLQKGVGCYAPEGNAPKSKRQPDKKQEKGQLSSPCRHRPIGRVGRQGLRDQVGGRLRVMVGVERGEAGLQICG